MRISPLPPSPPLPLHKKASDTPFFVLCTQTLFLSMICDHCVLVCMFLERLWEEFCNILSGVGGSEWGLCSIVGPRQEGIINSSLNAPGIATSDRVHSSSLRRYIGILSQFSNSNSAEIDVYKKIRYISCVSSVLHCLVNNICGKKWLY